MSNVSVPAASPERDVPAGAAMRSGVPRPRRAAILTVLAWNLLPAIALTVTVTATLAPQPERGEDWSGLVAVILMVVGGGWLVLSAGLGVAIAAILVGRQVRGTAARPAGITTTSAIGWGSLAAVGGWVVSGILVALFFLGENVILTVG